MPVDYYKTQSNKPERVHYTYKDDQGNPLFTKVRTQKPNERKTFVFLNAQGQPGVSELGDTIFTWFCRHQIRKAHESDKPIYLCEGEKAVGAAIVRELCATCPSVGKSERQWSGIQINEFTGLDVVIVADNDDAGKTFAQTAFRALKRVTRSVKIVSPGIDTQHADLYDHLLAGLTESDLRDRPDLEPQLGITVLCAQTVDPTFKREFVIEPYLPKGMMVLLDGDGGTGKTTIALGLAAMVTTGEAMMLPIPMRKSEPTNVIYIGDEDDPSDYVRVFEQFNGDSSKLYIIDNRAFMLDSKGLTDLKETILDVNAGLVIIDALLYYIAPVIGQDNINNNAAYRPILATLAEIYKTTNSCGMHIRHTNKAGIGIGPVQLRNSHRGQYMIKRMDQGIIGVIDEKGSIAIPKSLNWGFAREAGRISYTTQFLHDYDDDGKIYRLQPSSYNTVKQYIEHTMIPGEDVWYPTLVSSARDAEIIIGGTAVTRLCEDLLVHTRQNTRNYVALRPKRLL